MPDSFELFFWGILLLVFWLRGLANAAKKNRQRQEQALAEAGNRLGVEGEESAPAKRQGLRGQWMEMARQIERQMQQATEEGRPGSLVPHVEEEDEGEAIVIPGRRVVPAPERAARRLPEPQGEASSRRRERPAAVQPRERARVTPSQPRPAPLVSSESPLSRLERYPVPARAVILADILGSAPGLKDDPWDERWSR